MQHTQKGPTKRDGKSKKRCSAEMNQEGNRNHSTVSSVRLRAVCGTVGVAAISLKGKPHLTVHPMRQAPAKKPEIVDRNTEIKDLGH